MFLNFWMCYVYLQTLVYQKCQLWHRTVDVLVVGKVVLYHRLCCQHRVVIQ